MSGPVLSSVTAAQRDTDRTFLVDIGFSVLDPNSGGNPISILVEWSLGTNSTPGTWHTATVQAYDRLHTAGNPPSLTGVPLIAPPKAFNWVWNDYQDLPNGAFNFVWLRLTLTDTAPFTTQTTIGPIVVTTSVAGTVDPLTAQLARRAAVARTPLDPLGNGLDVPFRRGPRDFVSVSGVDLVRARVREILAVRAAFGELFGELPWRPDFGQKLWTLAHRNNDRTLRVRAAAFVRDALRWEKSVRVTSVFVERDPLLVPDLLKVHVVYEVLEEALLGSQIVVPQFTDTFGIRVAA